MFAGTKVTTTLIYSIKMIHENLSFYTFMPNVFNVFLFSVSLRSFIYLILFLFTIGVVFFSVLVLQFSNC